MSKSTSECEDFLKSLLPSPPAGISLVRLEGLIDPSGPVDHYYTVGGRHVVWEADNHCGRLSPEAIEDGEKRIGLKCAHMVGRIGCNVSYADHKTMLTLFVGVPQNKDLNAVPGLVSYLNEIKRACVEFGVESFAFPVV